MIIIWNYLNLILKEKKNLYYEFMLGVATIQGLKVFAYWKRLILLALYCLVAKQFL